eukprot:m51a1_g11139 hypothetical protein (467) ;mRNA; f:191021-192656
MNDNLRSIIQTFLGVFSMVALGQLMRRLLLKRPEDMRQLILYSRFYVWATIPCSSFLALSSLRSMPTEAYYLMACCACYEIVVMGLTMPLYAFISNGPLRASCVVSTTALSTGLYLALVDMLSGPRAVATLLLFDIPNNIVVFALSPYIMRWAMSPGFGACLRRVRNRRREAALESGAASEQNSVPRRTSTAGEAEQPEAPAEAAGVPPDPVEVACNDPAGMVEEVIVPAAAQGIEVVSVVSTDDDYDDKRCVELRPYATPEPCGDDDRKGQTPGTHAPKCPSDAEGSEGEKQKPRMPWVRRVARVVWSPDGKRILFNLPVWALVLGLGLGLGNVHLPEMLLSILRIPKNANALMAYTMLGLMLDLNLQTVKKLWPYVLTTIVIRNVAGITTGIVLRVLLGPSLSAYGRMIVLFAFSMSLASPVQVMGQEVGANVPMLALTSTISGLISFFVLAVMFAIDGVPAAS